MNDNVNVTNILDIVNEKKATILLILALFFFGSIIYSYTLEEKFKSYIYVIPAQDKYIQPLNLYSQNIAKDSLLNIKSQDVYHSFLKNMQSRKYLRKYFFDKQIYNYYLDIPTSDIFIQESIFEKKFIKDINFILEAKVVSRDIREQTFFTVSFVLNNPDLAAKFLNNYIEMVERETARNLTDGVNRSITVYKDTIQADLNSKRKLAKNRTKDRIIVLEEALLIANNLGIKDISSTSYTNQSISIRDKGTAASSDGEQMPIYLLGSDAIKAQIIALKNRKSEDPFIPNIRYYEADLEALANTYVNSDDVRVAEIAQAAYPPVMRFSPNRKLVVLTSTFLGFVIIFFYILISSFILKKTIRS